MLLFNLLLFRRIMPMWGRWVVLGLGLVPEHGLSRRFRDLHGLMNQRVAEAAQCVVFMVAGIPQVIKGRLPE